MSFNSNVVTLVDDTDSISEDEMSDDGGLLERQLKGMDDASLAKEMSALRRDEQLEHKNYLAQLEREKNRRREVIKTLFIRRIEGVNKQWEAETKQLEDEYEAKKQAVKDAIIDALNRKRKRGSDDDDERPRNKPKTRATSELSNSSKPSVTNITALSTAEVNSDIAVMNKGLYKVNMAKFSQKVNTELF